MILRSNKKWVYESPEVKQTGLILEALICQSVRFSIQVDEIHNMNSSVNQEDLNTERDPYYFEF